MMEKYSQQVSKFKLQTQQKHKQNRLKNHFGSSGQDGSIGRNPCFLTQPKGG